MSRLTVVDVDPLATSLPREVPIFEDARTQPRGWFDTGIERCPDWSTIGRMQSWIVIRLHMLGRSEHSASTGPSDVRRAFSQIGG